MLSKEIFVNRVEGVTVHSVEAFYRFKSKIKVIKDKDALIQIYRNNRLFSFPLGLQFKKCGMINAPQHRKSLVN